MLPHIEFNTALAIIGSVGTIAAILTNARISSWKARIEHLEQEFGAVKTELAIVKAERDQARGEIVTHYTARLDVSEENRELHKKVETLQEQVISLVKTHSAIDNRIAART